MDPDRATRILLWFVVAGAVIRAGGVLIAASNIGRNMRAIAG